MKLRYFNVCLNESAFYKYIHRHHLEVVARGSRNLLDSLVFVAGLRIVLFSIVQSDLFLH